MKKVFLFIAVVLGAVVTSQAQEDARFGVTAGYLSANAKIESQGISLTDSQGGFYIGLVADLNVAEKFNIQPELLYANVDDISFLQLPIMGKYYVAEKFNLQGGIQITYTLEEVADDFTKFNFGLGGGLGYDINEDFFLQARYVFQLNNYFTGSEDITSKIGFLNFGVGYKF